MSAQDAMLQVSASQALPGTPRQDGFFMPAEWAKQDAVWMLWPYRQDNWRGKGAPAQQTFAKVAKVLLPKDYLRLWLTGEHISEMSDSAGTSWLDTGARDWSDDLLSATGLSRVQMPRVVEGSAVSGTAGADSARTCCSR